MSNPDTSLHVRGLSRYIDDRDFPAKGLHCSIFFSPVAKGRILKLNTEAAAALPDVAFILTGADIPGENQIGGIIPDEVLIAESDVDFVGMPIAAVYAWNEQAARDARALIEVEIEPEEAILDPRVAYEKNELISPVRSFVIGDADSAIEKAAWVAQGSCESGAQEHFYLEGQAAIADPVDDGGLRVASSTQSPTSVQKTVARICNLAMHQVEIDVRRLGGAFGGKEDQASAWACFAALGALKGGVPCRMILRRGDDMKATGKRHPYSSDFTLALDRDGKFIAYKAMYYQNAGAAADLSSSVLERTLFHTTASYYVPNVYATAASCRTNITPNTAFRGFGGPQGMFVFEAAIREASKISGIPVTELQRKNLLRSGDVFPYGMAAEEARAEQCWDRAMERFDLARRMAEIDAQNKEEKISGVPERFGRGYALMPVCFGISFTTIFLNQGRALIHVYSDGSISVNTGAVEMGQGVNQKIRDVVAATLGVDHSRIRMETTNTSRVANTSPTAASSGSDINGAAAQIACEMILKRLFAFKAESLGCESSSLSVTGGRLFVDGVDSGTSWEELVLSAYLARVHLSAQAHYSTPELHFDKGSEKGHPFAYHSYGTAYLEAEVDRLLGTYKLDKVCIVHDLGRSINPLVDQGQIEGGLVQGIGWMTLEEVLFKEDGSPLTATAGTYKVPDNASSPHDIQVEFLEDAYNSKAVRGSKAVGEPPFMYGIGAYFAIEMAAGIDEPAYHTPITPERLFMEIRQQRRASPKD